MLTLLVILPAVAGVLALLSKDLRIDLTLLVATAVAHLVATAWLWGGASGPELDSLLMLDMPGRLFLSITSVIFLCVTLYTIPYIRHGTHDKPVSLQRFVPCLLWFLSAMSLVAVTQHLALMWAAVEGTTLASAPLVYFYRRQGALEASWKYLLLCSVGIALALLGTFFLGIAAAGTSAGASDLTLAGLVRAAPFMARPWLKAAFVLALVGYGTKMGLAPLHTWLPDAHSEAPSPVSALLSGALLNCAFLAILRFYQVCLASEDSEFAKHLLVLLGMASLGLASAFMVSQRDYKRLLAYSSIENMGIMAVGMGLGGAASYGALLHAVNHSLCKAGLFLLAGNVLRVFGTTKAREVRGVLGRLPATGVLLLALLLAIGGAPPFGPFWSEFLIFQSALDGAHAWLGILFVSLLAVAFLGMAGVLLPMLSGGLGNLDERSAEHRLSVLPPLVLASAALLMGVYIPPALAEALRQAAGVVGG
ncbi:MAG TPA: proton-conducting transporter membrane subunit [Myxococcota bacterium]|nr:proton-conducting transporter membrane subunit [Myxococcota bacterium]